MKPEKSSLDGEKRMSRPGTAAAAKCRLGWTNAGKGSLNFCRAKDAKDAESRRDAWKLASYEVAGTQSR
jgi:hypothetical protein